MKHYIYIIIIFILLLLIILLYERSYEKDNNNINNNLINENNIYNVIKTIKKNDDNNNELQNIINKLEIELTDIKQQLRISKGEVKKYKSTKEAKEEDILQNEVKLWADYLSFTQRNNYNCYDNQNNNTNKETLKFWNSLSNVNSKNNICGCLKNFENIKYNKKTCKKTNNDNIPKNKLCEHPHLWLVFVG